MKENHTAKAAEPRIVLASGSPRRKMLLEVSGIYPVICPSTADESVDPGWTPKRMVRELAKRKAADVALQHPGAYVIGADTLVSLDDEVLGKPVDAADACRILRELSGRTHQVQTGVCVVLPNGVKIAFCQVSHVTFKDLSNEEIEAYVATGEPLDKAGAYGIQGEGGALVASYTGDYDNIVGLPTTRLVRLLERIGAVEELRDLPF